MVVHCYKELVEVGRLVVVRVVWRLARVVIHGRFVIARKPSLRNIPAEIIMKTKSVALSAGNEKSCVLPRAFTNKADSEPFMFTIVFPSLLSFGEIVMQRGPPVSDTVTLCALNVLRHRELHHSEVGASGADSQSSLQ